MEKPEQRDGSSMDSRYNAQGSFPVQWFPCRSVQFNRMHPAWQQEPGYFFSTTPGLPFRSGLFLKNQMPSVNFADLKVQDWQPNTGFLVEVGLLFTEFYQADLRREKMPSVTHFE